jgi:hypothetical protein
MIMWNSLQRAGVVAFIEQQTLEVWEHLNALKLSPFPNARVRQGKQDTFVNFRDVPKLYLSSQLFLHSLDILFYL